MSPRHISRQAVYVTGAIHRLPTSCDRMSMGKDAKKTARHFIREWRKHRGYTQERFAEMVGVTQGHLSNIENGKRSYDQSFLEAAATELRCTPADLIVRDPTDPDGLWTIYDQLAPVERQQAVSVIKAIRGTGTGG